MLKHIRQWLEPPIFPGDPEKTARAQTMNSMGLYFGLALVCAALIYVPFFVKHKTESWAATGLLFVLYFISRALMFRGRLAWAGLFLIISGWLVCVGLAAAGGGISSPMMFALAAISIVVGLLFPARVGKSFLAVSSLAGLGLALLQQNGAPFAQIFTHSALDRWFFFTLSLVFINWTIDLTARKLETALAQARQQNQALETAQAASRESAAKYRKLHESLRDGFASVDMTGRIREFNETFRAMLGYAGCELENLSYVDLTPARWHAFEQALIEEQVVVQGYSQVYEKEYRRKDGTIFPVEMHVFLIQDENGANQGMWAIVRDITGRQRAEDAIRQRNAELTALNQIGQALSKLNEPPLILDLIAAQIGRVLDNRNLFIALYDPDSQYISFPVYTINGERVSGRGRPMGNGITDAIIRTRAHILIQQDQIEALRQLGIDQLGRLSRSFIGVPMAADQRVIGVIALQDYERENVYDEHTLDLLAAIAAQAAIALENARLYGAAQQELAARRRLEEQLQERARYIEMIMENAPIGFAVRTLDDMQTRFVSSRFEAIYGAPHGTLTSVDAFFNTVFRDPTEREQLRARVMADHASGDPARLRWENIPLRTADGGARYVTATSIPLPDQNLMVATVQDVTERVRAEQALRASERLFRAVVDNSFDGMILMDANRRPIYVSPSYTHISGYLPEEWIGIYGPDYIHPDDRARVAGVFGQVLQNSGQSLRSEYRLRHKQGHWFWVETTATNLLNDPHVKAVVLNSRDITDRRQAEQALRESELRFRALSEDALIGVYIIQDGLLTYANAALARIFGYPPEELVGLSPLALTHPDDRALVVENIRRRMAGETRSMRYEIRGVCKNGAINHVELIGVRVELNSQVIIIGNILDITERKRAEESLWLSEQTAHQTAEQLRMVNQIGVAIATGLEMDRLLQTLYEQCRQIGDTDTFTIMLCDHAARSMSFPFNYQDGERRFLTPRSLHEDDGIARYIIDRRQALFLPDLDALPPGLTMVQQPGSRTRSYVGLPLIIGEQVLGIFSLQSHALNAYSPAQIHTLELLATQVAIAIHNSQLFAQVQREKNLADALIDHLPGAFGLIDTQGRIVRGNHYAERVLGYTQAEIQDLTILDLIVEHDRAQVANMIARVFAVGQASLETQLVDRSGALKIPVYVTGSRIQFGDEMYLLSMGLDITERKQHEHELQAIATLSAAMRTALTRETMLPVIVHQIISLLRCDAVTIEMIDAQSGDSIVEAGHGPWQALVGARQAQGTGNNAVIQQTLQPYYAPDLEQDARHTYPNWVNDGIHGSAGVPLIAQEKLIGFIWVGAAVEITPAQVRLLAAIADIAANAIQRSTLHEQTRKNASDLALAYDTTLEGWARALELRDQETEGHTRRVVQKTLQLARLCGVDEDNLEDIRRGALLHDIGKMGIPDSVLLKPGTLDEREWEIMRRHPEYAFNLLNQIEYLRPALAISYCHHEKWDGSGYPRGLKGAEIPLEARIFAIVDVWDALTSDRPYRKAWSEEDAVRYIRQQSAKHFDPGVVEVFLSMLSSP